MNEFINRQTVLDTIREYYHSKALSVYTILENGEKVYPMRLVKPIANDYKSLTKLIESLPYLKEVKNE
jgi:hypothetical protein